MTTTPQNCLTFNLQRAARRLAREMEAALEPEGLSAQQFATLTLLAGLGPQPMTKLAEHVGADRTTLTRNVNVLKRRGLLEDAAADDPRAHCLQISHAGRACLDRALPRWRAQQERTLARLGEDRAQGLLEAARLLSG